MSYQATPAVYAHRWLAHLLIFPAKPNEQQYDSPF
jgi:hypothetical protein